MYSIGDKVFIYNGFYDFKDYRSMFVEKEGVIKNEP